MRKRAVEGGTLAVTNEMARRLILVGAGLLGAAGVMAAAGASHGESRNLGAIAAIGLAHAPALLALTLAGRGRMLTLAAGLLAVFSLVFIGDLAVREWLGHGLFPGAAPLAGVGMALGWLFIAVAGALGRSRIS